VAILQISRITQRKGLAQDLPQPLAGAELGWAIDDRRLYIGNGELADGAPVVGNTEILTEFSPILDYANQYTYEGEAAGYTVQTGATSGSPVTQSLQARLDSIVIVTDFGATGDGVTDDTAAINRALFQLYCRQSNPQIRRGLYFPAGNYLVTDTLLVPPYARLYGDGANSSIINFQVDTFANDGSGGGLISYQLGVLVKNSSTYYRSIAEVPIGINITNASYWVAETLPSFIMQTCDSLQQVGASLGTNGATAPRNIEITDMAFRTNQIMDGLQIGYAEKSYFNRLTVTGPLTTSTVNVDTDDIAAVRWASSATYTCSQIVFDECVFSGWTYGTSTDQVIEGATISNSQFDTLHQGIVLDTEPTGVRIVQNVFDDVYAEGIVIEGANLNLSAYNTFFNVGNNINSTATTPIIDFDANNNVSVGDMFERTTAEANEAPAAPRIKLNGKGSIAMGMVQQGINHNIDSDSSISEAANQLSLGRYSRTTGLRSTLIDNTATGILVEVNDNPTGTKLISSFRLDYTITRATAVRTGTLVAILGASLIYTDDFSESASTGVTLSVTNVGNEIVVNYATTSTGTNASIDYSINYLN
jgi:hypothetical protein